MNISGPAAVAKPEMLFYAPGDLTVTEQLEALGEATVKKEPEEPKKKKKREPVTNLLPQTKKAPFFRS